MSFSMQDSNIHGAAIIAAIAAATFATACESETSSRFYEHQLKHKEDLRECGLEDLCVHVIFIFLLTISRL